MFEKMEVLPGNIGYLPFNLFVDDIVAAKSTITAALKFLANTSALIIDLRENVGGSPEMVKIITEKSILKRENTNRQSLQ